MNEFEEANNTDTKIKTVAYDDEDVIWEGRPSQWINYGNYIWWSIFFGLSVVFMVIWEGGNAVDNALSVSIIENYDLGNFHPQSVATIGRFSYLVLGLISVMSILISYLKIRYEVTRITKNKICEAKGITRIFRQELFCEISDILDIKSPAPGFLGLIGLSTLVIETKDNDQPLIYIRAIKNREVLVEKLHPIWRALRQERKAYFGDN